MNGYIAAACGLGGRGIGYKGSRRVVVGALGERFKFFKILKFVKILKITGILRTVSPYSN